MCIAVQIKKYERKKTKSIMTGQKKQTTITNVKHNIDLYNL